MDATTYPVTHTDAEWRKRLTPEQFHIMREHGTERAGSCALNWEKRAGRVLLRGLRPAAVRIEEASSRAAPAGRASTIPCPARSRRRSTAPGA